MLKIVFFISFFLAFSFGSFCQSIGLQNVPPYGSYFVFSEVKSPDQLEHFILTKKLHNNIWDFRNLDSNMDDTAFYQDPKSNDLGLIFQDANLYTYWNATSNTPVFRIDSTGQYQLGNYNKPIAEKYETPVRLLKFPLQLGVNYSDTIIKRFDYWVIEQDSGKNDSVSTLGLGNTSNEVISDGLMLTNTDTFNCILLKLYSKATRHHQYKEYGKDWITTLTEIPDVSLSYYLFSNSIEPVARLYPKTKSDTGMYALQYLRKSVIKTNVPIVKSNTPFEIFPNPATNMIYINNNNQEIIPYKIIDILGQTIDTGILEPMQKTIDISHFNPGLYYMVLAQNSKTSIHKFIKN